MQIELFETKPAAGGHFNVPTLDERTCLGDLPVILRTKLTSVEVRYTSFQLKCPKLNIDTFMLINL